MQGKDGGPPEVVMVCGRAGGEDGVFAGGCSGGGRRWSQREEETSCRGEKDVHGGCSTTGKPSVGAGERFLCEADAGKTSDEGGGG